MYYDTIPLVVDLGKTRQRTIDALKRGEGTAMDDVHDALEELRSRMGAEADGKILVPVVFVYRKKQKYKPGGFG